MYLVLLLLFTTLAIILLFVNRTTEDEVTAPAPAPAPGPAPRPSWITAAAPQQEQPSRVGYENKHEPPPTLKPPAILERLDLTPEEYNTFVHDYNNFHTAQLAHGDSTELIKSTVKQIQANVDKEAVYCVARNFARGLAVTKEVLPGLIRMSMFIAMHRKYVPVSSDKKLLDIRLDINRVITTEFRTTRLSSFAANKIRLYTLGILTRIECKLDEQTYKKLISHLVLGYGSITKLYTIDNAITDAINTLNNGCTPESGNELIQSGFISYNNKSEQWIPTLKTKLYSYHIATANTMTKHELDLISSKIRSLNKKKACAVNPDYIDYIQYNPDEQAWEPTSAFKQLASTEFVEHGDRIYGALYELRGCVEPRDHSDLVDEGYIEYISDLKMWVVTDKIIKTPDVILDKLVVNDNDLYNDIVAFIKQESTQNRPVCAHSVFLNIQSFIHGLYGKLSTDDYNTMIANITRAFSML
jgi:hypothetical protein